MPETTVLEVRDEVLSAHVGEKIRVVSKLPTDTFAELGRVYTPGVGEVCRRIQEAPRMADLYTTIPNTVAIVSDGSAVMGLGNLGPVASMPVLEGKAALLARLVAANAIPLTPVRPRRTIAMADSQVIGALVRHSISAEVDCLCS